MTEPGGPTGDLPDGKEAQAQRQETVMPWMWGGIGLLVVLVFVVVMMMGGGSSLRPNHPVVAPSEAPAKP